MQKNVTLLFLLFTFTLKAQQPVNTRLLDSLFDVLSARELAQGSFCVARNGKVLYRRAVGNAFMSADEKVAADVDTRYRVGSVTKLFTAVMLFQMLEEGKINLDHTLNQYYPNLPNADKITIRQMLYHRSGLHDYTVGTNFADWMDQPKTPDELLMIVAAKSPDFEPDAKASYCNTNYLLLGYIIEKLDKSTYEKILQKRIISKTGLKNTYVGNGIHAEKHESASYKFTEGQWKKEKPTDLSIHLGAGAIVSTPTDLTQFIEALFTFKLVKKASLEQMKTMVEGYGMGMFPFDHSGVAGYGHNGRVEEFYSSVRYFPDKKLAFSYCTNGIEYPRTDIIEAALKICFNEPVSLPFSVKIALKTEELDPYLGQYKSQDPPIVVNCSKSDTHLKIETRGKVFELEPINDNYFMHKPTGYFFEFIPQKGELQIKETDQVYVLKKE